MMDRTRFEALAEAFGGRIDLWPDAEREAAWRFVAEQGETARALLADAASLDEQLQELRPPQPSAALRQAILDAAPRLRAGRSRLWRWLTGAGLGAGLAAACAAGVLAGAVSTGPSADATADALMAASDDGAALGPVESLGSVDTESNS
ncbi:hypothetical protein QO010_001305 [Caulobacter ginsengisoli]|uniref:Anti-sigma factor n=1 Tax=Caulobacter ginsengisoli TaxID=400775 RepID=A0ABU0INK2_9CAUL|nr:hypothetical protein [Caulobacter ginsengisoli]MDQ0463534.1 hypothetical protein [Caulobacter ginsengisoli]